MKLHLGCGQNYLNGYINIDYPLKHHNVQDLSVADKFADLTFIKYKKGSIEEIRLHHVFEHFPRAKALALIASWQTWLKPGGILRIEVPDFEGNARTVLSKFTKEDIKMKVLRHIFGSQEATWANHYHGWTISGLSRIIHEFGFTVFATNKNKYNQLKNIEIIASKSSKSLSKKDSAIIAEKWLSKCLTDNSESEKILFKYWLSEYSEQIEKTWGL